MKKTLGEFKVFRQEMNQKILDQGGLDIKRFFTLDEKAYHDGALNKKVKELLGLVASMALRCDDCVRYHLIQCKSAGVSREEFWETFNIALVVSGSIIIPHLRRAVAFLEELDQAKK